MAEFSIAHAKAHFAQLVQQAESGQPVHITRRGRAVAVVLSDAEYERLTAAPQLRESLFDFTTRMRRQAVEAGLSLLDDQELSGLRDQSERATLTNWS